MKTIKSILAYIPLTLPLYLVRLKVGPIPTNLLELIVIGLIGLVLYQLIIDPTARRQFFTNLKAHRSLIWICALILLAASLSVVIVNPEVQGIDGPVLARQAALGIWKGWLVMPIAYFLVVLGLKPNNTWKNQALATAAIGASLLSLWAVFQFASGQATTIDGRASGPFESANYLALFVAPILVASVAQTSQAPKTKLFWPWLLASLTIAAGLALSLSYGAFVGVFAGLATWLLLKNNFKKNVGPFLSLIAIATVLIISQVGTDKLGQLFDPTAGGSTSVRLEIYQVALAMIKNNPLLGIGLGQFNIQYPLQVGEIIGRHPLEWAVLHPHNLWLATWLNGGLLMVIGFVGLIIEGIKRAWTKLDQPKKIALAMLATVLVHGLFDTPYWKNDLAYLWWFIFALML